MQEKVLNWYAEQLYQRNIETKYEDVEGQHGFYDGSGNFRATTREEFEKLQKLQRENRDTLIENARKGFFNEDGTPKTQEIDDLVPKYIKAMEQELQAADLPSLLGDIANLPKFKDKKGGNLPPM